MNSSDGSLASVFTLGEDNQIYQTVYRRGAGQTWTDWAKLPGMQKFASAPVAINSPTANSRRSLRWAMMDTFIRCSAGANPMGVGETGCGSGVRTL